MSDRRLHPRSVFLAPAGAQLRTTVDAEIAQWHDARAVVIASRAYACGDQLLVHRVDGEGHATSCAAVVVDCAPEAGRHTRYRITLSLTPGRAPQRTGIPVA